MAVPEAADNRLEWLQQQAGDELAYWIDATLAEFQSAVDGVSVESGVDVVDIWVGGSFVDDSADEPGDLDIGVVTDDTPSEAVKSGFWRYVNDAQVLDIPLDVDCVWVHEARTVATVAAGSRQYSVQQASIVSPADYPQSKHTQAR